jgi:hypothetical protein
MTRRWEWAHVYLKTLLFFSDICRRGHAVPQLDIGKEGKCWEGGEVLGRRGSVGKEGKCWEGGEVLAGRSFRNEGKYNDASDAHLDDTCINIRGERIGCHGTGQVKDNLWGQRALLLASRGGSARFELTN